MYIHLTQRRIPPIQFDVLSFDELQLDVKSSHFEQLKNTSNKIRRIVFSVISVYKGTQWEHFKKILNFNE